MLRIFHVPSHLTYVAKLAGAEFAPVPSPVGRPLRLGELVALDSWDFFDVLHVHTVELATGDEIEQVALRATREDKKLVFTAHDLVPNIETDGAVFDHKTTVAARHAAAVMTLTGMAAQHLARCVGGDASPVRVVPHGAALPLAFVGCDGNKGQGVAAFGALRPNRDLVALVRAWRMLPPPRPPLRVLVRSLAEAERHRYATVLAELEQAAQTELGLTITTAEEVLAPDELASWCRRCWCCRIGGSLTPGNLSWRGTSGCGHWHRTCLLCTPNSWTGQAARLSGFLRGHWTSRSASPATSSTRCRCPHPRPTIRRSAHIVPPSIGDSSMLTTTCISVPVQRRGEVDVCSPR